MLIYACTSCVQSPADHNHVSTPAKAKQKNIYSTYDYADPAGARLVLQNSTPKSGIKYKGTDGKKYVYAVYWTRVINSTATPVELTIKLPTHPFEFPSSSGNHMQLLLPPDTPTADKETLYDYGLAVKPFLDDSVHRSTWLKRAIGPNSSSGFYVVTLSDRGVGGTLRTELTITGQHLFYTVNGKKIRCGKISSGPLTLLNGQGQ